MYKYIQTYYFRIFSEKEWRKKDFYYRWDEIPQTPLAGERLQPLGHLSIIDDKTTKYTPYLLMPKIGVPSISPHSWHNERT